MGKEARYDSDLRSAKECSCTITGWSTKFSSNRHCTMGDEIVRGTWWRMGGADMLARVIDAQL